MKLCSIVLAIVVLFDGSLALSGASVDLDSPNFMKKVENFSPAQFDSAVVALLKRPESGVTEFTKKLLQSDRAGTEAIHFACHVLSRKGGGEAIESIRPQLSSKSWMLRAACSEAYAKISSQLPKDSAERASRETELFSVLENERKTGFQAATLAIAEAIGSCLISGSEATKQIQAWLKSKSEPLVAIALATHLGRGSVSDQDKAELMSVIEAQPLSETTEELTIRLIGAQTMNSQVERIRKYLKTATIGSNNFLLFAVRSMGLIGTQSDVDLLKETRKRVPKARAPQVHLEISKAIELISKRSQ